MRKLDRFSGVKRRWYAFYSLYRSARHAPGFGPVMSDRAWEYLCPKWVMLLNSNEDRLTLPVFLRYLNVPLKLRLARKRRAVRRMLDDIFNE